MHKTLYLKYRPQNLEEIVGQEELVGVLKNSSKSENIAHSYLFSGGRGTGKTTTARAFAKELGIHKDDIFELDAASNSGVDDIRSLSESVNTLPYFSKYKMYILDEVHMLTKAASNAFLKTLEEPPRHCIFVLCTTDPEKMLDTVLSRCTKFSLKSPSVEVLAKYITRIAKEEGKKLGKEASYMIALSGDGSYRDSLSNLQKVFSFEDQDYSENFISKILGIPETSGIFSYLKSLDGILSVKEGLDVLKAFDEAGLDERILAKQMTIFARLVLLARHKIFTKEGIVSDFGEHVFSEVEKFLENKNAKINSRVMAKILEAESSAKFSSMPLLSYELLLLE